MRASHHVTLLLAVSTLPCLLAKNRKKASSGRIVGGSVVEPPHSLPWQVALINKLMPLKPVCGGTVLCPKYVMTAAHCVSEESDLSGKLEKYDTGDYYVLAGAHSIRDQTEKSRSKHEVERQSFIIFHHTNFLTIILWQK